MVHWGLRVHISVIFCLFSFHYCYAGQPFVVNDPFLNALEAGQAMTLDSMPGLNSMSLPASLIAFLHSIAVVKPEVTKSLSVAYITAGVMVKGVPVEIRFRLTREDNWSLLIGLPAGFNFNTIDTRLSRLNSLSVTRAIFVFNSDTRSYQDPAWNVTVEPGTNLILRLSVSGVVQSLLSIIPGVSGKEVQLAGSITSDYVGSAFKVILPGSLKFGTIGESVGLALAVYLGAPARGLAGVFEVVVSIQTGFKVRFPTQTDQVMFIAEITLTQLRKIGFTARMADCWDPAFNIKGFGLCDLAIMLAEDLAVLAASGGVIPISDVGLSAGIKFGSHKLSLVGKVDLTSTNWILNGELEGGLFLQDIADFGAEIITRAAHKLGAKANLVAAIDNKMPEVGVKKVSINLVPFNNTYLFGKNFERGISGQLVVDLFGKDVGLGLGFTDTKFFASGFISSFNVGPLRVAGIGQERVKGVPANAASVAFSVDPWSKKFVEFFIDGAIILTVPALGDLSTFARIDLSPDGIFTSFNFKLFELFQAQIEVWGLGPVTTFSSQFDPARRGQELAEKRVVLQGQLEKLSPQDPARPKLELLQWQLDNAPNQMVLGPGAPGQSVFNQWYQQQSGWGIHLALRQEALELLSNLIKESARDMVTSSHKTLTNAQNSIKEINKTIADYDAAINQLNKEIAQLEQENKQSLQQAIDATDRAQKRLETLQVSHKALDQAVAQCQGKMPKEAQEAKTIAEQAPISEQERHKALEDYLNSMNFNPALTTAIKNKVQQQQSTQLPQQSPQKNPVPATSPAPQPVQGLVPKPVPIMRQKNSSTSGP